jgi:hypothetical protein
VKGREHLEKNDQVFEIKQALSAVHHHNTYPKVNITHMYLQHCSLKSKPSNDRSVVSQA